MQWLHGLDCTEWEKMVGKDLVYPAGIYFSATNWRSYKLAYNPHFAKKVDYSYWLLLEALDRMEPNMTFVTSKSDFQLLLLYCYQRNFPNI